MHSHMTIRAVYAQILPSKQPKSCTHVSLVRQMHRYPNTCPFSIGKGTHPNSSKLDKHLFLTNLLTLSENRCTHSILLCRILPQDHGNFKEIRCFSHITLLFQPKPHPRAVTHRQMKRILVSINQRRVNPKWIRPALVDIYTFIPCCVALTLRPAPGQPPT